MDERLYQEALRRRDQLRKLLDDLGSELRAVDQIIRLYRGPTGSQAAESNSESHEAGYQEEATRPVDGRSRNPVSPRQIADAAREELIAEGRPMTRGQLVKVLEKRGVPLIAKDKAKNLGTILWRYRHEFENIPGRGYWPKDVPLDGRLL